MKLDFWQFLGIGYSTYLVISNAVLTAWLSTRTIKDEMGLREWAFWPCATSGFTLAAYILWVVFT